MSFMLCASVRSERRLSARASSANGAGTRLTGRLTPAARWVSVRQMVGHRGTVGRAVRAHVESHDMTRVIYGAVIGLALVVALESHPPTAGRGAAAILATAIAVGLAE